MMSEQEASTNMKVAKGDLPVTTNLIIQEETSPGNATPLLQRFPVVLVPRIGEMLSIEGEQDQFEVIKVEHTFHAQNEQNRQGIFVTVVRIIR
jgi:hypothetical protein